MPSRQTLRCVRPGCGEAVIYEPRPAGGGEYKPKPRIRIYLACARGHSHEYDVWTNLQESIGREAPGAKI